jgi:hypothetical protein
MAENSTAELLAGILDLAPAAAPPHPPGPCDALCVPSCVGGGGAGTYRAARSAERRSASTSPSEYATAT